ncbi:hypothetical protein [Bradyrhizobium sp. ORS 285]|uniref:hypothetical protein n=1 Tax=Bradyrhizobium sp. ORS 285 TaxID=115808 RepID=UPI00054F4408|nr:hypothetical protein [Bradyrhizobium sp. ORS 285]
MPIITDKIINAVIMQESRGDDMAIGDLHLPNKAYGPMQIRQPVCDDVNRVFGTNLTAQIMRGNRQLSIDTFEKYLKIYATDKRLGRAPTTEDICRIWNGGPFGYEKPSTLVYWQQIQRYL